MADELQSKVIEDNPIGTGLDAFRSSFNSICESRSISTQEDALIQLGEEDLQNIVLDLLLALQGLRASRLLRSKSGGKFLFSDLLSLSSAIISGTFDLSRIGPLLNTVLVNEPDSKVWGQVYDAVTESTPPPRSIASSLQQTPWLRNTASFASSSEHRKYIDDVLKEELGSIYVGLPNFHKACFGDVAELETASEEFFRQCGKGEDPFYDRGWKGWPKSANQDDVLGWFAGFCEKLATFAESYEPILTCQRRPLAKPNEPVDGSTAIRKMDVGFVNNPKAGKDSRCHWSDILIPGELKSNRSADKASEAWLDLGRYAREVLAAQDTRRFVLGFTICESLMRIWEFDRLGGIASKQFDINKDGLRFVSTILGFLLMNKEQLGFDPTFITSGDKRYIEITRDGIQERLIVDGVIRRAPCIAGRATTCWKAHRENDTQTPLVIKDSWQYTERLEEGELLREATNINVANVARYHHHYTVRVLGADDDIRSNVRKGLDITKAENYRPAANRGAVGARRKGRSDTTSQKRSASATDAPLPLLTKRSCSASVTQTDTNPLPNRVHRRVILRDYGKPIYKASSKAALLGALEGCIEGHESLHKVGFLHRDISINNLIINEDDENPSWPSFLIDLDLAIKVQREGASGAKGKTGTRAFMAIGALLGELHSFMHDLESFFWVLFWICVHYNGQGKGRVVSRFDKWNYVDTEELATLKKGLVADEGDFIASAEENFTPYYQPLIRWANRLRRALFPLGRRWRGENTELYSQIREILQEARKDPEL